MKKWCSVCCDYVFDCPHLRSQSSWSWEPIKTDTKYCLFYYDRLLQVMKWEDVELGEPKSREIRVKNKAIGLNYTDVYPCKGLVESFNQPLPFTPGVLLLVIMTVSSLMFFLLFSKAVRFELETCYCEAVGVIIVVAPDVTTFKVGDMVAIAYGLQASTYAEAMVLSADRVVAVPPSIDPVVAAAAIFKGLSAEDLKY
ncbi:putative 2-haloacrylate reductase [Helianthus annuus]|nr:putative 2-haloacrylate reductase [Helianthus annuus]